LAKLLLPDNWVAIRIPDGAISAHANKARIGHFPLDDPDNCLYSQDVIDFAIEKGYYDPKGGEEFAFNQAYNPLSPDRLRYCESRVWSIFRRAAPEQVFSSDFHRGKEGAQRYPLYIFPKEKLSLENVMDLVRDHYEGTEMDMTKGSEAGPYGTPQRWRPLSWEKGDSTYAWERPISTYNTCFSFIAQAQSSLPNELGGVCWFGFDDTYFTCYLPLYMGLEQTPESFRKGDIRHFEPASLWWAMNFVSNYANLKYSYMIKDIQKEQKALEQGYIADQDSIKKAYLYAESTAANKILQNYVDTKSQELLNKWTQLGYKLIVKYNDGYIKPDSGGMLSPGYPEEWRNSIIDDDPNKHLIPEWNKEGRQKDNPF